MRVNVDFDERMDGREGAYVNPIVLVVTVDRNCDCRMSSKIHFSVEEGSL